MAFEVLPIKDLLTRPNVRPAKLKEFIDKHYHKEGAYLHSSELASASLASFQKLQDAPQSLP